MANSSSTSLAPVTSEAFLRDRQGMLHAFTNFTIGAVVFIVILLVGMAVFLL